MWSVLRKILRSIAGGTVILSGLATGAAWGVNCYSCPNEVPQGCANWQQRANFSCCVDLDGDGIYHCATCERNQYLCSGHYYWTAGWPCTAWSPPPSSPYP